jgi:hypothetical protein
MDHLLNLALEEDHIKHQEGVKDLQFFNNNYNVKKETKRSHFKILKSPNAIWRDCSFSDPSIKPCLRTQTSSE